ncbi:MAG: phytoene/squalene synthase family protein [Candidatus Methanosuratincola sp.]
MQTLHYNIFKKGSKTFFTSTLFFPQDVKADVFVLYGYVRVADNLVDTIPQKEKEFYELMDRTERAIGGEWIGDIVVDSFAYLVRRRGIPKDWVKAFLWSMESDLVKGHYRTLDELKAYLYGSAEVIGLMMAKILGLPKESYEAAMHQGRAMQYINFIRDISEDLSLGRTYFPAEDLEEFGLPDLKYSTVRALPENFRGLMREELGLYCKWQRIAEEGYRFIPKRYLIPIKSAADMYNWTAAQISRDPFAVYRKKIRPSTARIFATASYNTLSLNITQKSRIKREAIMGRRQIAR